MSDQDWVVSITFAEERRDAVRATAVLIGGYDELIGRGRIDREDTRDDPSRAAEVAAARALDDLAGRLLRHADDRVEPWDDEPSPSRPV